MVNPYIGHESQLSGVEEVRLVGGKGDGMRLLQLRNGLGLEMTVCADRCADIYRLSLKGDNMGYFSPVGYVAPAYYDCNSCPCTAPSATPPVSIFGGKRIKRISTSTPISTTAGSLSASYN